MKNLFVLAMLFSFNLSAEDKIFCSLIKAPKIVKKVEARVDYDKAKHCSVSCSLNLYCNKTEVYIFGLGKEFADLLGAGTPDAKDIAANKIGISFSESGSAKTEDECIDVCVDYDWREL